MMVFDYKVAYIGSANLTGAGIGMKSPLRRNFEAGILTDEPELLDKLKGSGDQMDKTTLHPCYCSLLDLQNQQK